MLENIVAKLTDEQLTQAYYEFKELDTTAILCDGIVRAVDREFREKVPTHPFSISTLRIAFLEEIAKRKYQPQRAAIGDVIRIIGNSNAHAFEIGQHVKVIPWDLFGDPEDVENGVEASDGKESWFVRHEDYEVIR